MVLQHHRTGVSGRCLRGCWGLWGTLVTLCHLVSAQSTPEVWGPLALVLIILVLLLGIMLILVIAGLRVGLCSVGQQVQRDRLQPLRDALTYFLKIFILKETLKTFISNTNNFIL